MGVRLSVGSFFDTLLQILADVPAFIPDPDLELYETGVLNL